MVKLIKLKLFSDTYESGKDKLKLAEQMSDIGSDVTSGTERSNGLKKTRHSRALKKIIYSSDEEESEMKYPEVPAKLSQISRGCSSLKLPLNKSYVSNQYQSPSREDGTRKDVISKNTRGIYHPYRILCRTLSGSHNDPDM